MKKSLVVFLCLAFASIAKTDAQSCTPAGDQSTYGTNNTWIGYVYGDPGLTDYKGYVTEGTAGSPDFNENFGGNSVLYPTNGCSILTDNFSVRYKLSKYFAAGDYEFELSGDDAFRFSIDGGASWIIDQWDIFPLNKLKYITLHLDGTYNLVLEYYEYGARNTVSFAVAPACLSASDPTQYGSGNTWRGYVYRGLNFDLLKGVITEGTVSNPAFDENFSGGAVFNTGTCAIKTDTFTVRYLLQKNFTAGNYIFTVGGDDGYRLSVDGGSTWIIDNWDYHAYELTTKTISLSGLHNLVLEYFENTGGNRISFSVSNDALPIELLDFYGTNNANGTLLRWTTTLNSTTDGFTVERSEDGRLYSGIGQVSHAAGRIEKDKVSYSFPEPVIHSTNVYYRLKMIDLSGSVSYSPVVSLSNSTTDSGIRLYPTISDGNFYISSDTKIENGTLVIYDYSGREIFIKNIGTLRPGATLSLSVGTKLAASGIYIARITGTNIHSETKKIVLQK